jgi:anthranilate phosphoribosyltransferase
MAEGVKKAAELIDNGKALERLDALVKASNQAE